MSQDRNIICSQRPYKQFYPPTVPPAECFVMIQRGWQQVPSLQRGYQNIYKKKSIWTWQQLQTLITTDRHTDIESKYYAFSFFSWLRHFIWNLKSRQRAKTQAELNLARVMKGTRRIYKFISDKKKVGRMWVLSRRKLEIWSWGIVRKQRCSMTALFFSSRATNRQILWLVINKKARSFLENGVK